MDWTPIYDNPEYWSEEKLIAKWPIFENVATTFGKTHVKDSDSKDLYLNELDCDSDPVYKVRWVKSSTQRLARIQPNRSILQF